MINLSELNPFERFFYKSIYSRRPDPYKEGRKYFFWAVKYMFANGFFSLGNNYHSFLSFLTKYYPFSNYWQDKAFHHKHRKLRIFMNKIENLVFEKLGFRVLIMNDNYTEKFYELEGIFTVTVADVDIAIRQIEKVLKEKYALTSVENENGNIKILIPRGIMNLVNDKSDKRQNQN